LDRLRFLLVGLVLAISWSSLARGDTVELRYTITSGTVTNNDEGDVFPITGSYSVTYQSAISGSVPLSGPAALNTLVIDGSGYSISGDFHTKFDVALPAPLAGAGRLGSVFENTLGPLQLLGSITIHCFYTASCATYGLVASVPKQFPSLQFSAAPGNLDIAGEQLDAFGPFTIPQFDFGVVGIAAVGQEILPRILHPMDRVTITVPARGTPNPVDPGAMASVSVTAMDTLAHPLTFQWSADCPPGLQSDGSFADESLAATQWTAPANPTESSEDCTISVLVTDGAFGQSDGDFYLQTVPETSASVLGLSALATVAMFAYGRSRASVRTRDRG